MICLVLENSSWCWNLVNQQMCCRNCQMKAGRLHQVSVDLLSFWQRVSERRVSQVHVVWEQTHDNLTLKIWSEILGLFWQQLCNLCSWWPAHPVEKLTPLTDAGTVWEWRQRTVHHRVWTESLNTEKEVEGSAGFFCQSGDCRHEENLPEINHHSNVEWNMPVTDVSQTKQHVKSQTMMKI